MFQVSIPHTVVVEKKGFWIFQHWNVWDTRDPRHVIECWSKKAAGEVACKVAGSIGNISVLENGMLTKVVALH